MHHRFIVFGKLAGLIFILINADNHLNLCFWVVNISAILFHCLLYQAPDGFHDEV